MNRIQHRKIPTGAAAIPSLISATTQVSLLTDSIARLNISNRVPTFLKRISMVYLLSVDILTSFYTNVH
jgi:hypothetical protein